MSIEITFVRHGETDANAASIWQGQGDAALSEVGREQARALGERLESKEFDAVVSSDLARTVETAQLAGLDPVLDSGWREMDIGAWEGLSRSDVVERFGDEVERIAGGDRDTKMGGGESWEEFSGRVVSSYRRLVADTAPGSRVLVMAHGGVIHAVLASGLGLTRMRPWPMARLRNGAITEVVADDDFFHLQVFNDARHSPVVTGHEREGGISVGLIRHGESAANVAGQWHGISDGPLSERGARQAAELSAQYDGITRIFTSPLERTRRTAELFAGGSGLPVDEVPDLIEIDFGGWEGLTTSEIEEQFPDEFEAVFHRGEDGPRGGSGETFAGAGERMERAVRSLIDAHPTERMALFTHGGAIWALAARILGIQWRGFRSLAIPGNVSSTHLRFADSGNVVLVDYNQPLR